MNPFIVSPSGETIFHPVSGFGIVVEGPFPNAHPARVLVVEYTSFVGGVYHHRVNELIQLANHKLGLRSSLAHASLLRNLFGEGDPTPE